MNKPAPKKQSNDIRDFNHVDLLFPSLYLKAADLRGRDVTVVIDRIEPRHELQRQNGKDYKPVIWMRGTDKGWCLNVTNARTIAKLYGSEVTQWVGKAVTIYPTQVQFGRDTVEAIRVRPSIPTPARVAPPPPSPSRAPGEDDEPPPNSPAVVGYQERDA